MIWADLRILVLDTGRVWWRTLPQILAIYLAGWLGSQLALKLAIRVGEWNSWAALAVFAFGFLAQLVAIVVMLQIVGRELGVRDLIPESEAVGDDRDTSLTRLVSITLLPFLGIYAAFGEVSQTASQLANEQLFRNGVLSDAPSVLGTLTTAATQHPWWLLGGLVVIYLLRRGLDLLHERTGYRSLGILVALIESFFLLVVIMGGIRVWQQAKLWLTGREFMAWLATVKDAILDALSVLSIRPARDRDPGWSVSSSTRCGRCSGRRWPSRSSGWRWRPWCSAPRCSPWPSSGARGSRTWTRCPDRRRSPATPNAVGRAGSDRRPRASVGRRWS